MGEINVAEFLYNYARVFGWEASMSNIRYYVIAW